MMTDALLITRQHQWAHRLHNARINIIQEATSCVQIFPVLLSIEEMCQETKSIDLTSGKRLLLATVQICCNLTDYISNFILFLYLWESFVLQ